MSQMSKLKSQHINWEKNFTCSILHSNPNKLNISSTSKYGIKFISMPNETKRFIENFSVVILMMQSKVFLILRVPYNKLSHKDTRN